MNELKLIVGRSNEELGNSIAQKLGVEPTKLLLTNFSDGEIRVQILENIRGKDVFIVESTQPPAENIMEVLLLIDAAKRASARRVTAVIPYFGYARQERKDRPRVPISAKLVANLLVAAGADRILTVDLHSPAIQGFFDVPTDHLTADGIFRDFLLSRMNDELKRGEVVFVSPDIGGVKRIEPLAKELGAPIAVVYKRRDEPNVSSVMFLVGKVDGKVAIIRDDIIDTAGTICSAAKILKENGAKAVFSLVTHPLLSGPAVERLAQSTLDMLAVTDTLPLKNSARENLGERITVVSIAPLLAEAIKSIHEEKSVSVLFEMKF
ncbi:ribose-phosphate pyrophosphokinase [bacterium]|nr:ribose-phosphate pyrophosphokinase [bacterium]